VESRRLIEGAHFTPSVESLSKGATGAIGGDLDYTLRAIPNHWRALSAMMRLADREKKEQPGGAGFRLECYFDRAIRMAPDDGRVLALYGAYLIKRGREAEGRSMLEAAERLGPNDALLAYNLGLSWFDLKDYDKSLELAQRAYGGGVETPGLRDRLARIGRPLR
jgi:Tfp pilus assembly protein PilF